MNREKRVSKLLTVVAMLLIAACTGSGQPSAVQQQASAQEPYSNGDATFTDPNYPVTQFASWAAQPGVQAVSGDFNNDGIDDIALVGGADWNTIPVASSVGAGLFAVTNFQVDQFPGWAAQPGVQAVSGDFDHDGRVDDIALVGGADWNTIPVAYSQGKGTFTVTNFQVDQFPGWAAQPGVQAVSGDFDHDGRVDDIALVGGADWNTIPVAYSQGKGTFAVTNYLVTKFPGWAAQPGVQAVSGDFNNDGRVDAIALVGGADWNTIPVASSQGKGTFSVANYPVTQFPGWAAQPGVQAVSGDFDGDYKVDDIALVGGANWNTIPVAYFVPYSYVNGTLNATFEVTNENVGKFASWAAESGVNAVSGDFDGDGIDDIALVGGADWNTIPVASSQGSNMFEVTNENVGKFASWAAESGVNAVSSDFDGDGRDDIALVGGADWSTIPVAYSQGKGTFAVTNFKVDEFPGWAAQPGVQAVSGDFNNDGRDDIALVGGADWNTIPVAYSQGKGTFAVTNFKVDQFPGWAAQPGVQAVSGDFDGDGRDDIALVGGADWNTIPVASSVGAGLFAVTNFQVDEFPGWAAQPGVQAVSGDFNNDGRDDIALVGGADWNTIPVAYSQGNVTFIVTNFQVDQFPGWAAQPGVQAVSGDFDHDGRVDDIALVGGADWNTIPVAYSQGNDTFAVTNHPVARFWSLGYLARFPGWAAESGVNAVSGDFDHDGRDDIALVGGADWSTIPVAYSQGNVTFIVTNHPFLPSDAPAPDSGGN